MTKEGRLSQYEALEIIKKDIGLVFWRYLIDKNKL